MTAIRSCKRESKNRFYLKSIGPTYMTKTGKEMDALGDLGIKWLERKYRHLAGQTRSDDWFFNVRLFQDDLHELGSWFSKAVEELKNWPIEAGRIPISKLKKKVKKNISRGAQGSLLDIIWYLSIFHPPQTLQPAVHVRLGVAPNQIGE